MAARADAVPALRRVLRRRRDSHDTWTLEVDTGPGGTPFAPGQFNMLYAYGVGEIPVSFSGDPADPHRHVHTVRAVGAVSRAVAALRPGAPVGVRGPFGTGWPLAACRGRDVLVVAGGLGLAPLRPVLYALLGARRDFGRITLLCGVRSEHDLVYGAELRRWQRRADVDVELTVDHATAGWTGSVGVVTNLVRRAALDPAGTVALVCGPEVMMRFVAATLQARGLTADRIHVSLERNMHCATGHCGHCQLGPLFVCRDGPVVRYDRVAPLLAVPEL
jgi:NAD(P)H-flavin reductase